MMDETPSKPWQRWLPDMSNPWIWLAYHPLYGVTWVSHPPSARNLIVSLAGLALILLLNFFAERQRGQRVIAPAIAAFLLSFALMPFGGNWTVITVDACAIAADIRPVRDAYRLVGAFILVSMVVVVALKTPWYFVFMIGLFEFMVVYGKMSGTMLGEKHDALLKAQEEVRLLARTAERERIARDLHDLLGRTLTLIALKSDLAVKLNDPEAARREMREVGDAAREGLAQVRSAVAGMASAGLALEIQASRDALAAAGILCAVEGEDLRVPAATGAVLAMALREGVTNVIRHAGASHCRVALARDGEDWPLVVSDDGQGGRFREGEGLKGMRARLAAAGGRLRIRAGQSGTSVAAAIPAVAR